MRVKSVRNKRENVGGKITLKNFTDKEKVEKISFLSLRKKSRKIKFSLGKKNSGKYRLFLEGRKMYIYYVYIKVSLSLRSGGSSCATAYAQQLLPLTD